MAKEEQTRSAPHFETKNCALMHNEVHPFSHLKTAGLVFFSRDCLSTNVHFKPKRVIN